MKKNDSKIDISLEMIGSVKNYIIKNYHLIILILLTFLVAVGISFFKVATTNSFSSFNIDDYEVGQIADITVKSTKTLPPDYDNPVSVEKDEKIIRKGFPITEEGYSKLKKLINAPVFIDYRAFANSVLYHVLMCALFFFLSSRIYFNNHKLEFKELVTECVFYLIVFALSVVGTKTFVFSSPFLFCSIIPSSLFVFLVAILFGQLNAVFFALIISLNILIASSFHIVPFLFVLSSSLASARIVLKTEKRTDMVLASILQAMVNVVFILVYKIIFNDSMSDFLYILFAVALNGFFSGILCLGLLTPLELLLNTASPFRLMDLSDLNSPTMKKMLVSAAGTYNHSLMVASLAEAACNEIGANALLARVGSYYHDIGKLDNPEYFVENQSGDNIHTTLNPTLSVSIIKSHVKRGVEKGRALRLPSQVIDIIYEHHGNQVISYFYNEAKQVNPDASPEDFSYSGKPPASRESAIVMLADTVEAACRTLEKPSVPRLEKFINTLIKGKIDHNQLDNCNLSFGDITKIKDAFVQILAGFYHSRTKYPEQKDPDGVKPQEENVLPENEEKNVELHTVAVEPDVKTADEIKKDTPVKKETSVKKESSAKKDSAAKKESVKKTTTVKSLKLKAEKIKNAEISSKLDKEDSDAK